MSVQYAEFAKRPHHLQRTEKQPADLLEGASSGLGQQQHGSHNPFRRKEGRTSAAGDSFVRFGAASPILINMPNAPASPEFEAKAEKAIESLPKFVQKGFEQNGIHLVIAKFLTDAFPQLKGVVPRGWDPWTTWDNSDAVCATPEIGMSEFSWASTVPRKGNFSPMKLIPRSQLVMPRVTKPNNVLVKNTATEQVFRHEAGHAVDDLLRDASKSPAFEAAYQQDVACLTPAEKQELYYYLQPDASGQPTEAGRSEAFAESFANLYGGGCNVQSHFAKNFKNLNQFTATTLKQWEKELAATTPKKDSPEVA